MALLNKDIIRESILDIYNRFGTISCTLFDKYGVCVASTALRYFNLSSWIDLVESLGLSSGKNVTETQICNDITNVYNLHGNGKGLSQTVYNIYGKYSSTTIFKKFGSWHNALRSSNVKVLLSRRPSYSTEYLIKCIDQFVNKYGYVPAAHHLDRCEDKFSCSTTYYAHFGGSWQDIMLRCGYNYVGMRYKGKDSRWYDSRRERQIADLFFINNIIYDPHKKICKDRKWRCDFYLPTFDLWIEYDGYDNKRPERDNYLEKIQYYMNNNFKYLILSFEDNFMNVLSEHLCLEQIEDFVYHEIGEYNRSGAGDVKRILRF